MPVTRALVLALALIGVAVSPGCDRCSIDGLTDYCPEAAPCYPADGGIAIGEENLPVESRRGGCFFGRVECVEGVATCPDFVGPKPEICDGFDNDCNGRVDDGPGFYLSTLDPENDCNGTYCGRCSAANKICRDGEWGCYPVQKPTEETCNGLDDDCDCQIDNGRETEFYYPEDYYPNTVGVGECRPGVIRCIDGVESITLPVTPTDDVCDQLDNDCDGLIDENTNNEPKQFFLVIDVSGSMMDNINAVRAAICDFASDPLTNQSTFAVAEVESPTDVPCVRLDQDFYSAADTCVLMSNPAFGRTSGVCDEYMLQGLLLSPTWTDGPDHVAILFTDEEFQPYGADPTEKDKVFDACLNTPYEVGVFGSSPLSFSSIVNVCGGFNDLLYADETDLENAMLDHFYGDCR